jgi:CBS domain-containing protein
MTSASGGTDGRLRGFDYEQATAGDAMRQEVIYCPPEAPLRTVAQIMARDRIHCVVVGTEQGWGVVTDQDLLRAAERGIDGVSAGDVMVGDLPTVPVDQPLDRARKLLVEHEVSHALVVDARSGRPVGVLSTLDVAGVLAVGRSSE